MVAQFRGVILSRAEVAAMLHKAGRGQGMPLGHADVFVAACVRGLGDRDGFSDAVTRALKGPFDCVDTRVALAGPLALDALICGAAEVVLPPLDALEVLEFMVFNAFEVSGLRAFLDVCDGQCILRRTGSFSEPNSTKGPLDIPADTWALWQDWAALTYVPASEASRLAGAGAGLTDND